jgi:branched-subunit amino acid ABC-type transport system permease component
MARGKQIEFPPLQRHVKKFEYAMIIISLLCIVLVVLIAKATDWGITTRP